MTKSYPEVTKDILHYLKEMKQYIPEVMKQSFELSKASFTSGVFDPKMKELFALALAVATRCDGCIGFHAEALVKLKATRQEIAEMIGVAIYMGGGPSLMTGCEALKAFDQFSEIHKTQL